MLTTRSGLGWTHQRAGMKIYMQKYVEWLHRGLREPGKSQAGLARFLKISEAVVSRMVNGSRPLRATEIDRITTYFGFGPNNSEPRAGIVVAKVEGYAMENVWREPAARQRGITVQVVPHPDFIGVEHYAVATNDADEPTSYAICIKFDQLGRSAHHGDMLHIRRRKADLEQDLVRRVERDGSSLVLVDPKGQLPPLPLVAEEIEGIVVSTQTMFFV